MFKTRRLYLKLFVNRMELMNLETGESVQGVADPPFSGARQALGDFFAAEILLRKLMDELGVNAGFLRPGIGMLIQQLELTDGGLSQIELRGLRDLGNLAGARIVHIVEQASALSRDEAIAMFSDPAQRR